MTSNTIKKIYWFSGTHWDREWYRPFEGFRVRLVDMLDRAVECAQDIPGYGSFFLDGQSIILKDYLEARPDRREQIDRLLHEEKLFAGPFYVLQDEMVEDGELFVRNLQKGIALAREHGSRRFVGYSTDSFGHAAQLPQLLRLAGVESIVFSRAFVGRQQDNLWSAPDGSEVYFIWLPLGNGGGSHQDCLDGGRHFPEDRSAALAAFERFWERLLPFIRHESALIADAADHIWADPAGLKLAEDFNTRHPGGPHINFIPLPDAVDRMRRSGAPDRVRGEIRMSGKTVDGWLLPGTCSTRMPLKIGVSVQTRRLLALEKLLIFHPYCQTTHVALNRAWDALLQVIPHDSICGCHVDEVYIDNLSRLNSARSIIDYQFEKSLRGFCPSGTTTGSRPAAMFYDPSPDSSLFKPFILECPYPCIDDASRLTLHADGIELIVSDVERYATINGHLPTYRIEGFYRNTTHTHIFDVRMRLDQLRAGPEELKEAIEPLAFVDGADAGDSYNYSPPAEDALICSTGEIIRSASRRLNDRLIQTQIETLLTIPARLREDRQSRSRQTTGLRIAYQITRDTTANVTWISGTVHNTASDHRLRIVLPTPATDTHSCSGAPFHIERRPVRIDFDPAEFSERPLTDYPFVDYIRYGGVSVYSQSNGEYQITPRGIEITLCRCIGWLGRPDLAYRKGQAGPRYAIPMAQLLETSIPFAFVIAPTLSNPAADYLRKAWIIPTATQCVMSDDPPEIKARLNIAGGAELTAARRLDSHRVEMRLFNPSSEQVTAHIESPYDWRQVDVTDLHHAPMDYPSLSWRGRQITLDLRPFEIATLVGTLP